MKMRVLMAMLLAALLSFDKALSLKCYSCTAQPSNDHCMTPMVCSESDKYCMTIVGAFKIGSSSMAHVSKMCMPECTEAKQRGVSISCCQRDFCNGNSAAGVRLSNVGLLVGIVATLASAFFWIGP